MTQHALHGRAKNRVNGPGVRSLSKHEKEQNPMSRCSMKFGAMRRGFGAAIVALVLMASAPVLADDEPVDLPSRVGRIGDVAGELFLATQERANEWAPIGLNYPITSGDNLWVSVNGRAEIDF